MLDEVKEWVVEEGGEWGDEFCVAGLEEGRGDVRDDEVVEFRGEDEGGGTEVGDRVNLAEGCLFSRGLGGGDVGWEGCC